jgi:membrane carboxypeptidase/penicillin-binding protein
MGLFQFNDPGLPQQVIDENRGSFTFGPESTSPLGLASAYSTLAADGTRCAPTPVTAVLDRNGLRPNRFWARQSASPGAGKWRLRPAPR